MKRWWMIDTQGSYVFVLCYVGILLLFATYGGVMGVKAAKKKKKRKFRPIIKEFRVSTRPEAAQVWN